ncbi:HobA family DNA replication regulator [Aliarcobacter cryaerophilus]|uniref:HobA family DNA replication regulator n=2 Tax=unclassified Arcobacter TaxID=2593671 RepID=A0AA96CSI7_9BACT|nr:HobA family DNA replication regulator [Arcobacter sp. AZ-2023]WPD09969.1 HobA family DNA replication regulator [Arcobacter sp. DSM 115954]WNL14800.1 HobA family DNA replication regulator [Arcobacter sp. AZ-2023]WNL19317.1 HobA family DNA replication regulator [Arcobacter sp. AZ-2023]WNL21456.1 HobA family DNA replication regulator [Arcobacter sp. AZ-2023]
MHTSWTNNLQEFLNWTVDTIREDKLLSPWLEEKKFEWSPLVSKNITNILDKSYSILIITDKEREWFLNYILSNINSSKLNRPFLPFYDFSSFYKNLDQIKSEDDISNIKDMLKISFPNGYCFWYIGKSQDNRSTLAKITKSSFLWIFDEERQGSINLKSNDDGLDMKLLQMFRLYNKTISAALFANINVES